MKKNICNKQLSPDEEFQEALLDEEQRLKEETGRKRHEARKAFPFRGLDEGQINRLAAEQSGYPWPKRTTRAAKKKHPLSEEKKKKVESLKTMWENLYK